MRLPEIQLDDRRFQDLVSEARLKINRACPEWTEHNVSDPGITLIELFAWMTEMTIYRLNRVPDKLHVALLDLLGIRLDGPTAARTDVRFRLASPPEEPVEIPGGETEIATPRTPNEESIVFQVDEDFTIPAMRPSAYVVQRGNQIKDIGVADGEARPQGADQLPFGAPPAVGDALYLGFDEPIGRLLLQVDVDASQARGAGVNPEDPPLRWEVSQPEGGWEEAEVLEDLTGGFNYGSGTVELQCPERSAVQPLGGHRMHWIRCRIDDRTRHGGAATTYSHPPEIYSITATPIGALLPSTHAAQVEDELLGLSDGTPGQVLDAAPQPGAQARAWARRSRSRTRSRATGRPGSCARTSSPRRSSTATSPRPGLGRRRARTRDPRDRRRLDPVRRGAAQGRGAALHALPPRRRPPWEHHRRRARRAAGDDPRRRQRHEPEAGRRRRRRRGARARPPARVDGDPHALPRGDGRGLRVPRRRGLAARRARGLRPARRRRAPSRCTSSRTSSRPTASSPTSSSRPTRTC